MTKNTYADKIIKFYEDISKEVLALPNNFKIVNPFIGNQKEQVRDISRVFYYKYYNDNCPRRMILGSSPARRGTAVLGVPFEVANHLQEITGIKVDNFHINKSSSNFLSDVIELYGGYDKFYSDFYLNFVCPLGIVKILENDNVINCNYYENKKLQESLYSFIIDSLYKQLDFGIDTSICYCIGSGENYKFLLELNNKYNFFKKIIPLEHPRFIMQYNSKDKDKYIEKYLKALSIKE